MMSRSAIKFYLVNEFLLGRATFLRFFLTILIILIQSKLVGQFFKIIDDQSNSPVKFAAINYSNKLLGSQSADENGQFLLYKKGSCLDTLVFNCYTCESLKISYCDLTDSIFLTRDLIELDEVTIESSGQVDFKEVIRGKKRFQLFSSRHFFLAGSEYVVPIVFKESPKKISSAEFKVTAKISSDSSKYLSKLVVYSCHGNSPGSLLLSKMIIFSSTAGYVQTTLNFEPPEGSDTLYFGLEILDVNGDQLIDEFAETSTTYSLVGRLVDTSSTNLPAQWRNTIINSGNDTWRSGIISDGGYFVPYVKILYK